MSELNPEVLRDGQLAVAISEVSGDLLATGGATDKTVLVQTDNGPQLAVKTFLLGATPARPQYVDSLPAEGEEGILYMVNTGTTRDGYAIFQMFSWHEGEYVAIGAFDVGINPTGLVYEQSFNASTGVWTVTVA